MQEGARIERAAISVDVVCFALRGDALSLVLVQRALEPFAGAWALPGGALLPDESLDAAAARLLFERTGLDRSAYLEQLYTFGAPQRDPRGRTLSVAYVALLPTGDQPALRIGRGVRDLGWFPTGAPPHLAFDHGQIVKYARWRLSQKLTYTPLAFRVLPETFTLADVRLLHEAVDDRRYDPSNFQKQMLARWDLAPLSGVKDRRSRRPARLYRYIGPREIAGPPPTIHAPAPPAELEQENA